MAGWNHRRSRVIGRSTWPSPATGGKNGGRWVVHWYVGERDYKIETVANADDIADADGVAILSFAHRHRPLPERCARAARIASGIPIDAGPAPSNSALPNTGWMEQNRKGREMPATGSSSSRSSGRSNARSSGELRGWLQEVAKAPARVRAKKGSGPRFREVGEKDEDTVRRRRASANRTLTILKASLNMAWREGKIASDDAWRRVTPFEEADAARVRYLQIDEAQG